MISRRFLTLFAFWLGIFGVAWSAAPPTEPLLHDRPFSAWLSDLDEDNVLIREEALEVLSFAGARAEAALPKIRAFLNDDNQLLRRRAAVALWRLTGESKPAVHALASGLEDAVGTECLRRLALLGEIGEEAVPAIGAIVDLLNDDSHQVRERAEQAIRRMGRAALPSLLKELRTANPRIQSGILAFVERAFLEQIQPGQLPLLFERLKDNEAAVRRSAAQLLWRLGHADRTVLAVFRETIESDVGHHADRLHEALRRKSKNDSLLVPLLIAGLSNQSAVCRVRWARKLYQIEKKPERVLPIYLEALAKHFRSTRHELLGALGELEAAASPAIPWLMELARPKKDPRKKGLARRAKFPFWVGPPEEAREILVRIGPKSLPFLIEEMKRWTGKRDEWGHEFFVVAALGDLGKPAVKFLLPLLEDENSDLVLRALTALQLMGPNAGDVVPHLVRLLEHQNTTVRDRACATLGKIGPAARRAIPKLLELARHGDVSTRIVCFEVLSQFDLDPKETIPIVVSALDSAYAGLQFAALRWLIRLDPEHPQIEPMFRKSIKIPTLRITTLRTMQQLGPRAGKLVPAIVPFLRDHDSVLREETLATLGAIGPAARAAAPAVLEAFKADDLPHPRDVFDVLKKIDADPAIIAPALIEFLQRSRPWHQATMVYLGECGSHANEAFPLLLDVLRDPDLTLETRSLAAPALVRIDPERTRRQAVADLRRLSHGHEHASEVRRALDLLKPNDPPR